MLQATADDLHALRAHLGDSADAKIERFDAAIDPYVRAVGRLAGSANEDAVEGTGAGVRHRGDALYRAAQAARLRSCGRGGNAIAERGTFAVYVLAYRNIYAITQSRVERLARAHRRAAPGPERVAAAQRITHAWRAEYRATGRLEPPRKLRRLHQSVRRVDNEILTAREVLEREGSAARKLRALDRIERLSPRRDRLAARLNKAAGADYLCVGC